MGTNFYFGDAERFEKIHIGKRSAAGWYCWDCRITLRKDGESGVHQGDRAWHDRCPQCGKTRAKETIANGAAGLELGFNKSTPTRKTGVASGPRPRPAKQTA